MLKFRRNYVKPIMILPAHLIHNPRDVVVAQQGGAKSLKDKYPELSFAFVEYGANGLRKLINEAVKIFENRDKSKLSDEDNAEIEATLVEFKGTNMDDDSEVEGIYDSIQNIITKTGDIPVIKGIVKAKSDAPSKPKAPAKPKPTKEAEIAKVTEQFHLKTQQRKTAQTLALRVRHRREKIKELLKEPMSDKEKVKLEKELDKVTKKYDKMREKFNKGTARFNNLVKKYDQLVRGPKSIITAKSCDEKLQACLKDKEALLNDLEVLKNKVPDNVVPMIDKIEDKLDVVVNPVVAPTKSKKSKKSKGPSMEQQLADIEAKDIARAREEQAIQNKYREDNMKSAKDLSLGVMQTKIEGKKRKAGKKTLDKKMAKLGAMFL